MVKKSTLLIACIFYLHLTYSIGLVHIINFSDFDLLKKTDTSISKINIYRVNSINDTILTNVIKYDNLGRLNTIISLIDGKNAEKITNITFFENTDIVLSRKSTSYNTGKPSTLITAYDYDSLFRIKFTYAFEEDTSNVSTQQFFYNNKTLFKIDYKPVNSSIFYTKYILFHDAQNRLIKRDCYGRDKKLLYTETEEFTNNTGKEFLINNEGKILKHINEYKDNKPIKRITPADIVSTEGLNNNITLSTQEKTQLLNYDANNNLIEIEDYVEGKLIQKLILVYVKK